MEIEGFGVKRPTAKREPTEPTEPKDPVQYWVRTSDVTAQDLVAIVDVYRSVYEVTEPPEDGLDYERLMTEFRSGFYTESPIGQGARLELRGKQPDANNTPEFIRVKIVTSGKNSKQILALQEGIDGYLRDKGIPLLSLGDIIRPRPQ